jgi:hypothetical protein
MAWGMVLEFNHSVVSYERTGGACGYGNLFAQGYGTRTTALSTALFSGGAACGQCYKLVCDRKTDATWCKPGVSVTVTATNFCPPNSALPDGGWCNAVRAHFDMAQPAGEKIGVFSGGIIPVIYRRVSCVRKGGVRFTVNGHDYFNLVLLTNVAGPGSIRAMDVKGSQDWMHMARNWGANWHSLAYLTGQGLSFRVTVTDGQTIVFARSPTSCRPSGGSASPSPATSSSSCDLSRANLINQYVPYHRA